MAVRRRIRFAATLACALPPLVCPGEEVPTPVAGDPVPAPAPATAPDEELFLFEELPVVVSSSRQETPQHLAMAPVSVITGEHLDSTAYTNIYEPFAFVPGVDLLVLGRSGYAMGVRGLHDGFSDRTLSLVDGRPADSAVYGGSQLNDLPLNMADIERIEVVRGPGGAVWGANAFAGVVNLITKRPDDPTIHSLYASGLATHYGDLRGTLRHAGTHGTMSWRATAGGAKTLSSADALNDEDLSATDWDQDWSVDGELLFDLAEGTELRVGLGYLNETGGADTTFGESSNDEAYNETTRSFASFTHAVAGGEWRADFSCNYQDIRHPTLSDFYSNEYDLSIWYTHHAITDHVLTIGGNGRYVRVGDMATDETDIRLVDDPDEGSVGAFIADRWQAHEDLVLEAQLRVDDYSETDTDWSGRVGAVYTLDEEDRHHVRVAGARAFRTPYSAWRRIDSERVFLFPGFPLINADPAEEVDNEHTWALEAGWTGLLNRQLTMRVDVYYQRYEDLIGINQTITPTTVPVPFPPFSLTVPVRDITIDNIDGADSYGTELEANYRSETWEVGAWYAWNGFEPDQDDQALRAYQPAEHKAGASFGYHFNPAWSGLAQWRWTDETEADSFGEDVEAHHRVDLYLRWHSADGRCNIVGGIRDLFDELDYEAGGIGNDDPTESTGFTVVLRGDWNL